MSRDGIGVVLGYIDVEREKNSGSARLHYSKVQSQSSNRSYSAMQRHSKNWSDLDIHFWNMTLALCTICSSIAHGSSIHRLFHVWLVVGVAGPGQDRPCTLCQAPSDVTLVECSGERSLLASCA